MSFLLEFYVFFAFRMAEFVELVFQYNQTDWNWVNLIIMMGKTFYFACVQMRVCLWCLESNVEHSISYISALLQSCIPVLYFVFNTIFQKTHFWSWLSSNDLKQQKKAWQKKWSAEIRDDPGLAPHSKLVLNSCSRWPIALAPQVAGSTGACVRAGVPGWLKWLYMSCLSLGTNEGTHFESCQVFFSLQILVFKNYSVIMDASQDTAPIWSFLRKTWLTLKCKENLLFIIHFHLKINNCFYKEGMWVSGSCHLAHILVEE